MLGRDGCLEYRSRCQQEYDSMAERRRRKLVAQFQYKLIARMVIYWLIYQVTLFNLLFACRLLEEGKGNLLEQFGLFLQDSYPMLICFAVLVPAFAWDAVKFYHKVAGPIYRFRKTAREIAAEEPIRRVKLRDGDELLELQDDFNAMIDTLARLHAVKLVGESNDAPTPDESTLGGLVLSHGTTPEELSSEAS